MIFSIFNPLGFLIHLYSSLNNGLHVVNIMTFYFVSLARSPIWLQTYTNTQRAFLLFTVREFGKYFIKLTTTLKKTITALTVFLETREYFVIRNIKNVSSKVTIFFIMCYPAAYNFHKFVSITKMKNVSRMYYVF